MHTLNLHPKVWRCIHAVLLLCCPSPHASPKRPPSTFVGLPIDVDFCDRTLNLKIQQPIIVSPALTCSWRQA